MTPKSKPKVAAKGSATPKHKKPKIAKPQQAVKKPVQPIQPAQPIGPIGGFPGVSTPGFMRGLARQAGMMKGEVKPKLKIPIRPKLSLPKRTGGGRIMGQAQSSGGLASGKPGVMAGKR